MTRSWDSLTPLQRTLDIILLVVLVCFFAFPFMTNAVAKQADMKCTADKDYSCACNTPKEQCPGKKLPGGKDCPCTDITSGHPTPGKCQAVDICKGQPNGGEGKMPEMPKMPEPPPSQPPPPTTPTTPPPCGANATSTDPTGKPLPRNPDGTPGWQNPDGSACTPSGSGGTGLAGSAFSSPDLSSSLLGSLNSNAANNAILDAAGSSGSTDQNGNLQPSAYSQINLSSNPPASTLGSNAAQLTSTVNTGSNASGGTTAGSGLGNQFNSNSNYTFTSNDLSQTQGIVNAGGSQSTGFAGTIQQAFTNIANTLRTILSFL
jgi:hypothetical protein